MIKNWGKRHFLRCFYQTTGDPPIYTTFLYSGPYKIVGAITIMQNCRQNPKHLKFQTNNITKILLWLKFPVSTSKFQIYEIIWNIAKILKFLVYRKFTIHYQKFCLHQKFHFCLPKISNVNFIQFLDKNNFDNIKILGYEI